MKERWLFRTISFIMLLLQRNIYVMAQNQVPTDKHPLTPLDPVEIQLTSDFIRQQHPDLTILFITIALQEPPKSLVAPYLNKIRKPGADKFHTIPRRSITVFLDKNTAKGYEVIINLTNNPTEVNFRKLPEDNQPGATTYEVVTVTKIARNDPEVKKRLQDLEIEPKMLDWEIWDTRLYWDPKLKTRRLYQLYLYFKEFKQDNLYAHPLNFSPVVDVFANKVLFIEELPIYANFSRPKETKLKLPKKSYNYSPKILGPSFYRQDAKGIKVSGAPAFKITDTYDVSWQKFKIRVGFTSRDGLTLNDITYKDGKKVRPILYRASIPELFIPYGDSRPPFHKKPTFDFGGKGGQVLNSQRKGVDCLSTSAQYIDVVINNDLGQPLLIPNAICIYERDGGILHKHTAVDLKTPQRNVTIARARILVFQTTCTIENYDYIFTWNFEQDASIRFEAQMTGLLNTILGAEGLRGTPWTTLMADQVQAQYHQHLFSARLDFMVDGENNTVSMVDVVPVQSYSGNGITTEATILKTELGSRTDTSMETVRIWKIWNSNSINPITKTPVAYKLMAMNKPLLLAKPGSVSYITGRFATHSIWVTKYNEDELFPAGNYIDRNKGTGGLADFVKNDENIVNEDVVVWHTFGVTHIPRTEEFPIMATESTGFKLKPCNFFKISPARDVPPAQPIK